MLISMACGNGPGGGDLPLDVAISWLGRSEVALGRYCISMFIMTWAIPCSTASSSPRSSSPASLASSARPIRSVRSSSERTSSAERVGAIAVATPLRSTPTTSSGSPASSTQFSGSPDEWQPGSSGSPDRPSNPPSSPSSDVRQGLTEGVSGVSATSLHPSSSTICSRFTSVQASGAGWGTSDPPAAVDGGCTESDGAELDGGPGGSVDAPARDTGRRREPEDSPWICTFCTWWDII